MPSSEAIPAGASGTRTRFAGSLKDVSIGDLFQTLEMSGKTSQVELDTDIGEATVWFREREIIDAVCGDATGADAIYRLAMADDGSFVARFRDDDRAPRLHGAPQRLLMEAARRRDEWFQRAGDGLRPDTRLAAKRDGLVTTGDGLSIGELALLARLDGATPLVDVIPPGDDDATHLFEQIENLRELDLLVEADPTQSRSAGARVELAPPPIPESFWVRGYATYVTFEHTPARWVIRCAALLLMLVTAILGLALWSGRVALAGQLLGWALLLLGHATTTFPQLPFRTPALLLCEPLLFVAELLERVGMQFSFTERGRALAQADDLATTQ